MCGYVHRWKGKMGQIIEGTFTMKHKECNCFDKSRNILCFFLLKVFIKKESSRLFLCPWRNHSRLTKSLWRLVLSLMHREMWFYFQSIRDCRKVIVKVVNKAKQTEGVYCFQKGPGSFLPTRKHYGILITTNSSLTILPTDENRLVKESRHI